jgi:hypothetical protein
MRENRTDDGCEGGKRSPNKEPHTRELDDSDGLVRSLESIAEQPFSTPTPTRHAEELVEQAAAHGECYAKTMTVWMMKDWDTCIERSIGERLDSTLILHFGDCLACIGLERSIFSWIDWAPRMDGFSWTAYTPFRDDTLCKFTRILFS